MFVNIIKNVLLNYYVWVIRGKDHPGMKLSIIDKNILIYLSQNDYSNQRSLMSGTGYSLGFSQYTISFHSIN